MQNQLNKENDLFIINRSGILQTDSKYFGKIFEKFPLPVPQFSNNTEISQIQDHKGREFYQIYSYISNTPFILIEVANYQSVWSNWFKNRNQLLLVMLISVILIVLVSIWGSNKFINIIKEKDIQAAQILHEIEYTNKMVSIGRLAAGVSHEINNPLAIINENAGMISDILKSIEDLPEKNKIMKYLNSIFKNVERCSRITHQLLGFAKRMEPNITQINLYEFVNEVVDFVGNVAKLKNVEIQIFPENGSEIVMYSDKGFLQQVFVNILNNSIEAVPDGGKIQIFYRKLNPEEIEIRISDNGKGIPEKDLPHIFEPFFTTKKEYGTGLGLSITYGIVKKLGGEISVESKENVGTTFILKFPINQKGQYGEG